MLSNMEPDTKLDFYFSIGTTRLLLFSFADISEEEERKLLIEHRLKSTANDLPNAFP